jgi:hypothetical protein
MGIKVQQPIKPFILHMDGARDPTEASATNLIKYFQHLHAVIVPLAFATQTAVVAHEPAVTLSPHMLLEFITQDTRLLPRWLYALASGILSYPLPNNLSAKVKSSIL